MKIIDQYIYAIGQKLPLKGRADTKKELKSLLLDEIEAKYGSNPLEKDVKTAISAFGSPLKVARKYSGEQVPISAGYADLFFLISGIMIFAMFIAYTTIFLVQLFTKGYTDNEIFEAIMRIPLNIITSSLSGIGSVTIVFVILTKISKENKIDLEKDWTPNELKGILLEDEIKPKSKSIITLCFLTILIFLINLFPQIITIAEDGFVNSGIALGHRVVISNFRIYAILLSIIWLGEIVYNLTLLKIGIKTKILTLMEYMISVLEIIIFAWMLMDSNLYMNDTGLLGFKIIFGIVLIVSLIEVLVALGKTIMKKIAK